MSAESTDVFGLNDTLTGAEAKDLRKRDLKNLLTSYADEADLFAEIIQNGLDSLLTALNSGRYKGSNESPQLHIVIGRRSGDPHYFGVYDNGMGMEPNVVRRFTIPGYSSGKKIGKTVGYKGVGASFFFACSNRIMVQTKGASGAETLATVENAHRWITNDSEPEPETSPSAVFPEALRDQITSSRGTAICYFCHSGWKPATMSSIVLVGEDFSEEIGNWASYLCSKTALGRVEDISSTGIEVIFHLDRGTNGTQSEKWIFGAFSRQDRKLGYPFPSAVLKGVAIEKDFIDSLTAVKIPLHLRKYQAFHLRWSKAQIQALTPAIEFMPDEQALIDDHFDFVDLFFAYSTDVLSSVQKRLGSRSPQVRYGIRIVVDGVPQGRMVDFDLTSNQGLSRQAHAVISFTSLELDTGRKIPANEVITEVIRKIGVRAMTTAADARTFLRKKDRPSPAADLLQWENSIKAAEADSLVVALYKRLRSQPPLSVDPDSENDVIALFSSMLTAEVIKGYDLHALSGFAMYDGMIAINVSDAKLANLADPLSIRDSDITREGKFKVIEFKQTFDLLIQDFEEKKKNPSDINIAVCWNVVDMGVTRGSLQYCYGDRVDNRPIYAATHIWTDQNDTSIVPIISLKHVCAIKLAALENEAAVAEIGTARLKEMMNRDHHGAI